MPESHLFNGGMQKWEQKNLRISPLPTSEERRKIILDMLLKGCYVSDIYERFGVKCPDE